jgi:hypothetical protein
MICIGRISSAADQGAGEMNCGARIECVTPDGQPGQVSKLSAPDPGAAALIMEDDTVTCLLQEGRTDFVVELPKEKLLDRLTFLNENALARGELKIAVANEKLRADSSEWVAVEGIIPFSHKRLFGVSLIGIEARFVRLSFEVEKRGEGRIAMQPVPADSAKVPRAELVMDDLAETKSGAQHHPQAVLLGTNEAASVGPLSASR